MHLECFSPAARRLAAALVLLLSLAFATTGFPRESLSLDQDWRFLLDDKSGAEAAAFDDSNWRRLDVPHDWSIEGEYKADNPTGGQGGFLPAGIGWYRRTIDMPAQWQGRSVRLEFDGVYMDSTVWLNGEKLGGRPYGYISFGFEIGQKLKAGRNTLAVRVNTELAPSSRWYTGSGIYGHVRLIVTDPVHVAPSGIFARTTSASAQAAQIDVTSEVENAATGTTVKTTLLSATGETVAEADAPVSASGTAHQSLSVRQPHRWSHVDPYLYTLRTRVMVGGRVVDEVNTPFGIRTIAWDANRGFLLNGEVVKLQGVCEHHDAGPVGAAIPDALLERRLRQLQEMGVNAIRTAHNPRTPIFYDLCDRMGLLVMDEIFDGWRRKAAHDYGARFFNEWWKKDVTDWIRRDRNHPSIVIYSIGNETGDRDVHGITPFIRSLDPTRPTTGGQILEGVDVIGLNGPGEVTAALLQFRKKHPDRPFVLTEEPHTYQTRGYYRVLGWYRDKGKPREEVAPYGTEEVFTGGDRRYNSSYDNSTIRITARECWKRTKETPWIAGEFRWTGFDYLGESGWTAGGWPARFYNHGIIDIGGIPKDHYYFYQSMWTSKPMLHLLPHWTHPGLDGKTIPVVAYSNCDEVELALNGKSLGRKRPNEYGEFVWQVPYSAGELTGVGYRAGKQVTQAVQRTAGVATRISLSADNTALKPDRTDLSVLTFAVTDANGVVVPSASDRIEFKTLGPVQLLGYENGDPLDVTAHRVGWRKAFAGLGRGFFQATGESGAVEINAAGILGPRLFESKATVAIAAEQLMLRGAKPRFNVEIHYTVDGSEPTKASPRYSAPFTLEGDTRVRALVLRDGARLFVLDAEFRKGRVPTFTDSRFVGGSQGAPEGPWDDEAVGRWKSKQRQLELKPDGKVLLLKGGESTPAGIWWYDYPNDRFEAGDDTGVGEILWKSGNNQRIKLTSPSAKQFVLITGGINEVFDKVP